MTFTINFIKNETFSDLKNAFVKKSYILYIVRIVDVDKKDIKWIERHTKTEQN